MPTLRLPTAGDGISPATLFPSLDGVKRLAAGLLQEAGGMASAPESSGSRGIQRLRHRGRGAWRGVHLVLATSAVPRAP
jgi:hypothetical protein